MPGLLRGVWLMPSMSTVWNGVRRRSSSTLMVCWWYRAKKESQFRACGRSQPALRRIGPATGCRTPNGLNTRPFWRGVTQSLRMWHEVICSLAAAGRRVPRTLLSSVGPPPNGSFILRYCRNRITSLHSQDSSTSRWPNWIRAWHRVSCDDPFGRLNCRVRSTPPSQGWAGPPRSEDRCLRVSLAGMAAGPLRVRDVARSSGWQFFRLKMIDISLCPIASEPLRVEQAPGGGRSRHRPLRGADRCVGPTSAGAGKRGAGPGRTCRPRGYSMARWTSFTSAAPRPSRHCFGPNQGQCEGPDGANHQGYPMVQRSGEQGWWRDASAPDVYADQEVQRRADPKVQRSGLG